MRLLTIPVEKEFEIKFGREKGETAEEPGYVSFRQATTGDDRQVADLTAETIYIRDPHGKLNQMKQNWNGLEIVRLRCYLTMSATRDFNDQDGKPIFAFKKTEKGGTLAMSDKDFNRIWDLLPSGLTDELYSYCKLMNPQWEEKKEGEEGN